MRRDYDALFYEELRLQVGESSFASLEVAGGLQ